MPKKTSKRRICHHCKGRGWLNPSRYKTGVTFEYKVIQFLRDRGWKTTRSYGSKGIYDIIAQKDNTTLGIQAKNLSGKNKSYLTPKDRESLNGELIQSGISTKWYTLYTWTSRKTPTREVKFDYPIRIIHAYKDGIQIQWRELVGIDEWVECSNLIKYRQ